MDYLKSTFAKISEYPTLSASACVAGLYASYYLTCVVKRPVIACGDKRFRQFLMDHCPIAKEKFWPTWWCLGSRSQTILRAVLMSKPSIDYTSEYLETPDGGEIRLDWKENDENSRFVKEKRPTVLLLPGITGSSKQSYILNMVKDVTRMGYRSVVFNNRGTGDCILKSPRTYCAADSEDTEFVISHIKNKYPDAPLMGVGVSLGGIILFNYMAKNGDAARLDAAMCISVVYDVFASLDSLNEVVNYYLFNKLLARSLVYLVERNLHLFEEHLLIDTDHVLKSESIKDFDERFTVKIFGYDSVDHFYTEASLHTKVHALRKPVLCLSAADDPFSPGNSIPVKDAEENDNIAIVKTSHGGHIGFLEGTFPRDRSYMYRWFNQFVSATFEQGMQLKKK